MSTDTEPIRRSIEVEYWVVDDDGRLVEPDDLTDAAPGVEREFVEPLLEIKTTPHATTADLRAELYERVGRVVRHAEERGKHLVPLATPIYQEEIAEHAGERTRVQNLVVGDDFEYVRHCAGTHVHVEQLPERAIEQLNAFVALDPALALCNSAPYFRGRRLAAGARSKLYRRLAYADVPHQGWLWPYVEDRAEWRRRLERRYEDFVHAAADAGVDRRVVERCFEPESVVWTPVQLRSEFGTVEWRSPDAAGLDDVVRLADRLARVTERVRDTDVRIEGDTGRVADDEIVLPEFDVVLGYVDAAIEEGLDSTAVTSYLERMGFDVGAYEPTTHELDGPDAVSRAEARELRLEHAERLAADVRREVALGDD
ncbi:hypothetical protein J2752_000587 [Halarchaeum rubridurum]|uniref:Glutamate--cysteine ligase n=1 Tax=Halarchaeum rubridurum TaxID=489911 RepID=A0A830FN61_9EURY|nr:glutamate-cysteine ligase family protein [Halarchaeum rubridurum]MBP1953706.1 hypothetical protein [Halarchaeum rubridurum]GGM54035.1 hypothetical protein GCM10009017_00470 [Halarchaeum rubridurum]